MFSTGPMFLSAQYGLYTSSHPTTFVEDIRILPKSLYGKNAKEGEAPHSFFSHYYGSSWHADDAGFIFGLYAWGKGLMWVGLIVLIVGIVWLPAKKRRYNLRRMGGYEVLFRRTGWHFHLGGPSESSTQLSSPDIGSEENSSDVPVLHLPFDVRPGSPSSSSEASTMIEPYAGRVNSPIVEAFQRIRNRVASLASPREEVQRSPVRPRRQQYSRGVLFFLPAIFTPNQDIELSPTALPRVATSTTRAAQLRPPEKPRYPEDLESVGDLRRDIPEGLRSYDGTLSSIRSSNEDLMDVEDLPSRPQSRSSSSSRRSTPRPLIPWDS
jgi:inositol phosphorylceramide mannosyltransferase catalytic subunit